MSRPQRIRYSFLLNPYDRFACTRCPKCKAKTKQRKLPLAIHIEPSTFCILNKTCRYCPACELVVGRKREIEPLIAAMVPHRRAAIEQGKYLVLGTLDRADWLRGQVEQWMPATAIKHVWCFKSHLDCVVAGGWQRRDAAAE